MSIMVFIYNIALIMLYTIAICFTLILYQQKKRPVFLTTAVLFLFYILDNTVIYMTEFLTEFARHYNMQFMNVPAFKIVIIVVCSYCMVMIQHDVLPEKPQKYDFLALILLGLALIFVPLMPESALMVWCFYLPCQIFTFYLGISGYRYMKRQSIMADHTFLTGYANILMVIMVFSVLIVVEDSFVIFSWDVYSAISVKINNRSVTEDIMSIIMGVFVIQSCIQVLQLNRSDVNRPVISEAAEPVAEEVSLEDTAEKHLKDELVMAPDERIFSEFVSEYNLTGREAEILRILLEDKNNQEISAVLFISVGTVKTHVHNIFQKADVTKRSVLIHKYNLYKANASKNLIS